MALLLPATVRAQPGTLDGQLVEVSNNGTQFVVAVQLRATGAGQLDLGTSTFHITFNDAALDFASATHSKFYGNVNSGGGLLFRYNQQSCADALTCSDPVTQPLPNKVSFNVEFLGCIDTSTFDPCNPVEGQPIPTTFETFATMTFDITDPAQTSNLAWDVIEGFNAPGGPTGQYTNGTFTGLDVVLPVEFVSFDGLVAGEDVVLRWETASETNNAGFEVEQRGESGAFVGLGFVEGAGTTAEAKLYSYRVSGLSFGRHVFRLRQVDFDGTFAYSAEVEVVVGMSARFVLEPAYPNPFNPVSTIRFAVREATPVRVEVFDLLGRRVQLLFEGIPDAGQIQEVRLDGGRLSSGLYLVRLHGEGVHAMQKVLLQK